VSEGREHARTQSERRESEEKESEESACFLCVREHRDKRRGVTESVRRCVRARTERSKKEARARKRERGEKREERGERRREEHLGRRERVVLCAEK
jgi:hypothetical protein